MGTFNVASHILANGTATMNKLFRTDVRKNLHAEIDSAAAHAVAHSDNFALEKMRSRDSVFGSDDPRGAMGLNRVAAAHGVHGRETADINAHLSSVYENMRGAAPGSEEYRVLAAQADRLRKYKNSPGRYMETGLEMGKGALQYMNSGSLAQRAVKFGTLGAAYVGTAGAVRSVTTGGNVFYDGDGRKSIAGLPF